MVRQSRPSAKTDDLTPQVNPQRQDSLVNFLEARNRPIRKPLGRSLLFLTSEYSMRRESG